MVKSPHTVHTTSDMLTLPVQASTPVGDTKMPEPIMQPTMTPHLTNHSSVLRLQTTDQSEHSIETPHPFRRLSSAFSLTPSPLSLPLPSSLPPSDL